MGFKLKHGAMKGLYAGKHPAWKPDKTRAKPRPAKRAGPRK